MKQYRGVSKCTNDERFQARIRINQTVRNKQTKARQQNLR